MENILNEMKIYMEEQGNKHKYTDYILICKMLLERYNEDNAMLEKSEVKKLFTNNITEILNELYKGEED